MESVLIQRTAPANTTVLQWMPDANRIWLTIRPRPSSELRSWSDLFRQPPGEVQFGDTLPDDVNLSADGHTITLGELRDLLRSR